MTPDNISEYRLIHDYGDQPVELFDGFEPDHLFLSPQPLGWPEDFAAVDLIKEISNTYRKDSVGERYRLLYEQIPHEVMALDKSSNKKILIDAYLAVIPSSSEHPEQLIVFSLFEVSLLHYNGYIHQLYAAVSSAN
jgi:hypothetical protein